MATLQPPHSVSDGQHHSEAVRGLAVCCTLTDPADYIIALMQAEQKVYSAVGKQVAPSP